MMMIVLKVRTIICSITNKWRHFLKGSSFGKPKQPKQTDTPLQNNWNSFDDHFPVYDFEKDTNFSVERKDNDLPSSVSQKNKIFNRFEQKMLQSELCDRTLNEVMSEICDIVSSASMSNLMDAFGSKYERLQQLLLKKYAFVKPLILSKIYWIFF